MIERALRGEDSVVLLPTGAGKSIAFQLGALTTTTPISLIVVDEARCVSQWGHYFRTAYLNLGRITRAFCTSRGVVSPLRSR